MEKTIWKIMRMTLSTTTAHTPCSTINDVSAGHTARSHAQGECYCQGNNHQNPYTNCFIARVPGY